MAANAALRAFFQGYLHEDWRLDAESPEGLLLHHLEEVDADTGFALIDEISVLLAFELGEGEVGILYETGAP